LSVAPLPSRSVSLLRSPARALCGLARSGAGTVAAAALSVTGCSVLLDWSDYTGNDAGTPPPGISCGADRRCVALPPTGWSGPLALYEGPASGAPPGCPAGSSMTPVFEGNGGLVAPAASCSACVCSPAQGGACSSPLLSFYSDSSCTAACGTAMSFPAATCAVPPACAASFEVGTSEATAAGTCTPSGGTATLPPVTWSQLALACAPAAAAARGTCSADQLCVPSPSTPFPPRLCVMQTGQAASCPGKTYVGGPYIYHAAQVDDTRRCTPCACGPPTGASCSFATIAGFGHIDTACSPIVTTPFSVPSACRSLKNSASLSVTSAPNLTPGTCQPSGGDPAGAVTTTASITFCCTP